nr:immunoglobulin light chain junction region [Macaca mulatta]MOV73900.1 immunoglobulin light chain junction region [Macaca mulatta]MOV74068.1 immunoglobulin light chain junction region [Macaca mulatta]MOW01339.1 immunoglobulin light chain junction region [Macaca mulatta]MOW06545.1 immunoglobulin light chain junction region [Macaca mulatta]
DYYCLIWHNNVWVF